MKLIKKNVLFWLLMAVVIAGCNKAAQMNEEDGMESTATGKTDVSDVATDAKDGEKDPTSLEEPTSLNGTKWKLAGIVDMQTGDMMEPEPILQPNCKVQKWRTLNEYPWVEVYAEWECLSLEFDENVVCYCPRSDCNVLVVTSSNKLCGTYNVDTNYFVKDEDIFFNIKFGPLGGTEVGETVVGRLYNAAFYSAQFFSLKENELRLYYNDNKNFLLFKSLKNHE